MCPALTVPRDNRCPPGPWIDQGPHPSVNVATTCVPTTIHRPHTCTIARNSETAIKNHNGTGESMLDSRQTEGLFQTASLLPGQYCSTLDPEAMKIDAFYALSELFTFTATSEKQFLNFMDQQIRGEIYSFQGMSIPDFTITNLKYFRGLLDSHISTSEQWSE